MSSNVSLRPTMERWRIRRILPTIRADPEVTIPEDRVLTTRVAPEMTIPEVPVPTIRVAPEVTIPVVPVPTTRVAPEQILKLLRSADPWGSEESS